MVLTESSGGMGQQKELNIGVMSDSHGNISFVEKAISIFERQHVALLMHLGDDYNDVDGIVGQGTPLIRVPGTWSSYYQNPLIDNRRIETIMGWRFGLSHTPEKDYHDLKDDPDPEVMVAKGHCDRFLHGHTHVPHTQRQWGVIVHNPGHLKQEIDRGHPATCSVIHVTEESLTFTTFTLDGAVFQVFDSQVVDS